LQKNSEALDWLFVVCFARMLFPETTKEGLPPNTRIMGVGGTGKGVVFKHLRQCLEQFALADYEISHDFDTFHKFTYRSSTVRFAIECSRNWPSKFGLPAVSILFPNVASVEATILPAELSFLFRWSCVLYLEWLQNPRRHHVPELLRDFVVVDIGV
jgi:hypothetical protein